MEKASQFLNRRLPLGRIAAVVLFLSASMLGFPAAADNPHFTAIDVPGAARTIANDVNRSGDVVGIFSATCAGASCSAPHGFILRSGTSEPEIIDVPGNHVTILLEPGARVLAERLQAVLDAGSASGAWRA